MHAHLQDMEPINGHLEITMPKAVGDLPSENDGESFPIGLPIQRKLYKSRKNNLYYLQTHHHKSNFNLDDVCLTMQMTFSTHISNAFDVMMAILVDNVGIVPEITELFQTRLTILKRIKMCVDKLIDSHNAENNNKIRIKKDTMHYREMENYIGLILFKLYIYFNKYLTEDKTKRGYFKNKMHFNPRHTNYVLYIALKNFLMKTMKWDSPTTIDVIRKLFIQENILMKYLLETPQNVRKNALKINTRIERTASKYGDPYHSLLSYFEFFENPVAGKNANPDGGYFFHDYLEYANIDVLSNKFDYNDKIVLIEMRSFPRLITSFLLKFATPEIKEQMKHNSCHKFKSILEGVMTSHTISDIVQIMEIYKKQTNLDMSPSRISVRRKLKKNKTLRKLRTKLK